MWKEYITVLACGSAIGEKLPPFVLYKVMPNHTQNGPDTQCRILGGWKWQIFKMGFKNCSYQRLMTSTR